MARSAKILIARDGHAACQATLVREPARADRPAAGVRGLSSRLLHLYHGGLNYWLHMLLFTYMNIAVASSWNIIGGYAGYISLGHNVFLAVGGYFSGILFAYYGISPFITTPLAGLAAMAVGVVVGMITLRTRGPTFIISTIALVLLTKIALDNWDYIGGANGMSLPLLPLPVARGEAAVLLRHADRRDRRGLPVVPHPPLEVRPRPARDLPGRDQGRGRRHSDRALQDPGVRHVSGLFVGMAGALWGYYLTFLRPTIFLSILIGAKIVLMTILGGRGTVAGPVVGAILFVAANEFFVASFGASELNIAATGAAPDPRAAVLPRRHHRHAQAQGQLPKALDWD